MSVQAAIVNPISEVGDSLDFSKPFSENGRDSEEEVGI